MRFSDLVESEGTDHAARIEANEAYDRLLEWFERCQLFLDDVLTSSSKFGGCYAMKAVKAAIGNPDDDLIIIFAPKQKEINASFGLTGSRPVILLPVLKGPYDLTYINTRLSGQRSSFVHEYQHYLTWSHKRRGITSSVHALKSGHAAYYNHPEELNAYYQEGASDFYRIIKSILGSGHKDLVMQHWGDKSTPELVADIMRRFMNRDFVEAITPQNRKRIEKRLARYIEQTIRPLFAEDVVDGEAQPTL